MCCGFIDLARSPSSIFFSQIVLFSIFEKSFPQIISQTGLLWCETLNRTKYSFKNS